MNRIIRCEVENEFIRGAGVVIGAAGSHDDVELELRFSPVWEGTAKKIVWFDALGENAVVTSLGTDLLLPGEPETYRVRVPHEAKAVEGDMLLTIRGVNVTGQTETRAVVAATAPFRVLPALWDPLAVESSEPSASVSDQLRQEIESIKSDIVDAAKAADALEESQAAQAAAETAQAGAETAQKAAEAAKTAAVTAKAGAESAALEAAESAQTAKQYSGKPPIIQTGTWWTWNAAAQKYEDTGNQARGQRGETGAKGDTGSTGPQGVQGTAGAQGPKGDKGDQGETGPAGPQGVTGATGSQGPRGPAGADGRSFTVKGVYTTLAALLTAHPTGTAGDAYAVGTAENNTVYLWDVDQQAWTDVGPIQGPAGPQGAAGPTGPAGPQGIQGNTGPAGPQGPQGIQGQKGDTGAQGPKGDTGATGPQGPAGATGPAGEPGADGKNGKSAYQMASEAGYIGTEVAFAQSLAKLSEIPWVIGSYVGTITTEGDAQEINLGFRPAMLIIGSTTNSNYAFGLAFFYRGYTCVLGGVADKGGTFTQTSELTLTTTGFKVTRLNMTGSSLAKLNAKYMYFALKP